MKRSRTRPNTQRPSDNFRKVRRAGREARKGGKPLRCTDEIIAEMEKLVPIVMYVDTVADYLGVDRKTLGKWMQRGRREQFYRSIGREPTDNYETAQMHKFYMAYKKALARGEMLDAGTIKKAGEQAWQAAAWRLERRFPEKWSAERKTIRALEKRIKELEGLIDALDVPEADGEG